MSFLESLAAAFKGSRERVPLARNFTSPWVFADGTGARAPFEYSAAVKRAYLDNPVAQRAVRLVSEGIGSAALLPTDPALAKLVSATSAGQSLLDSPGPSNCRRQWAHLTPASWLIARPGVRNGRARLCRGG